MIRRIHDEDTTLDSYLLSVGTGQVEDPMSDIEIFLSYKNEDFSDYFGVVHLSPSPYIFQVDCCKCREKQELEELVLEKGDYILSRLIKEGKNFFTKTELKNA